MQLFENLTVAKFMKLYKETVIDKIRLYSRFKYLRGLKSDENEKNPSFITSIWLWLKSRYSNESIRNDSTWVKLL